MKDLNFFEPYIEKKEFKIDKLLVYYSIAIFLVVFLLFYSIFNQVKIRRISREVVKLRLTVEDERINKKVNEIMAKEKKLVEFNSSLEKIKKLDQTIEDNSIIDSYLLDAIISKMPDDVFFTSISIYTDNIEVIGIAKDKWSISELGKGLETIEKFKEVFVSTISFQEEHYNFTLNINLKDVNIDGEETTDEEDKDEENTDEK